MAINDGSNPPQVKCVPTDPDRLFMSYDEVVAKDKEIQTVIIAEPVVEDVKEQIVENVETK